jgi:hypothetical protein
MNMTGNSPMAHNDSRLGIKRLSLSDLVIDKAIKGNKGRNSPIRPMHNELYRFPIITVAAFG